MERLITPHGITVSYEQGARAAAAAPGGGLHRVGCQRMQRNLSSSEWKEHVGDEPYR